MTYFQRTIEPILKKAAQQFPAIVLTGPRQAGKTTLLKHLFSKTHRYISLEPPDVRAAAIADPRGFINLYSSPVIFDEIQYAPELFFYIKEKIDEERSHYGRYILTGSQNILLLQQVTETLAGRAAILRLLPLSYPEMIHQPFRPFVWEKEINENVALSIQNYWKMAVRGSYPELTEHPEKEATLWQSSYIQTYLERDIRTLRQIGDLTQFQLFLKSIAARSAGLFQLTDVAKDIGISVNTAKAWLNILEATYQVIILRPYYANINKRLVKTPKVYFTDVGTLCYLLGYRDSEHLLSGPMAGPVTETFVFSEIFKRLSHQGIEPQMYFWRTSTGTEVDLLIEVQGKIIPIEIKASSTPKHSMIEPMLSLYKDLKEKVQNGYLVHLGDMTLPLGNGITAIPFSNI